MNKAVNATASISHGDCSTASRAFSDAGGTGMRRGTVMTISGITPRPSASTAQNAERHPSV